MFKIVILLIIYSCTHKDDDILFSFLHSYNYKIISKKENSVYLFLDLNSCGSCLQMIKSQLKNKDVKSELNLILIEGQKGLKVFENELDLTEFNVIFIPENLFVEFNEGYGFFIYLYFKDNLVKKIDLNIVNVENSFKVASMFYHGTL